MPQWHALMESCIGTSPSNSSDSADYHELRFVPEPVERWVPEATSYLNGNRDGLVAITVKMSLSLTYHPDAVTAVTFSAIHLVLRSSSVSSFREMPAPDCGSR